MTQNTSNISVVWVLGSFPSVSETFLLRQITGLMDRGVRVELVAQSRGNDGKVHDAVERYGLMDQVRYTRTVPSHYLPRLIKSICLAGRNGIRGWRLWCGSLSRKRFGRRAWSLRPFFEGLLWLEVYPADVIITSYGPQAAAVTEYQDMGLASGKLVSFFRGYDATRVIQKTPHFYDRLFSRGDLFLPVSQDLQASLLAAGCPAERTQVLRGGVELPANTETSPPRIEPGSPIVFFSACRLVEKKGLGYAIEAMAKIAKQGLSFRYIIAGQGPARDTLTKQIARLGLTDRVELCGWKEQAEIRHMLRDCHIVVSPSVVAADGNREGVPNIIKEAMANQCPVVATRHGGIPEIIEHDVSGWLVAERDAEALAQTLVYVAEHPESWRDIAEAGRHTVSTMFEIEQLNDELLRLLEKTVASDGDAKHKEPAP